MKVDYDVALEIASHEAVIRQAYKDSIGVRTWSVGLTNATGHDVKRYIDNPQPLKRCFEVYAWALDNYAEAVRAEFARIELTKEQFAGALSCHWNTGAIRSASWPDLWKSGKISEARASFLSWRKPAAIIPRREKEAALFFDRQWSNDGTIPEYTRLTSTHTPVWGSAVRINVEAEMRAALGEDAPAPTPAKVEPGEPSILSHITEIEARCAAIRAAY